MKWDWEWGSAVSFPGIQKSVFRTVYTYKTCNIDKMINNNIENISNCFFVLPGWADETSKTEQTAAECPPQGRHSGDLKKAPHLHLTYARLTLCNMTCRLPVTLLSLHNWWYLRQNCCDLCGILLILNTSFVKGEWNKIQAEESFSCKIVLDIKKSLLYWLEKGL